ncbi:MAG: sodium:proton antiporter NhaD [Flavisolibacter sp.]
MAGLIILVFFIGYVAIALEYPLMINKAASALITGVLCWTILILFSKNPQSVTDSLSFHLGELSQILFFLMGAMTIVELIDAHEGFEIITNLITTRNKKKLIWIICFLTFFLSALLDNLTTTIVMISLVRKLIAEKKDRLIFVGAIVLAANAGGAWSPIGDVTTTMLWIGGQVTAGNIALKLIIPSIICLLVPLLLLQGSLKGQVQRPHENVRSKPALPHKNQRKFVFFCGIGIMLLVPVFKTITHLPPFMGILLGLGLLWVIVEFLHSDKNEQVRSYYSVSYALKKIDTTSILFFLGILLAIGALESSGQLRELAQTLNLKVRVPQIIVLAIGLLSSVVDNVPLVAASKGMYSLQQYPTDHFFWEFLAYCTGTGGSLLIIGSAAGVAAMGIEKIDFIWYLKKFSWLALIGYLSGALIYILQEAFLVR